MKTKTEFQEVIEYVMWFCESKCPFKDFEEAKKAYLLHCKRVELDKELLEIRRKLENYSYRQEVRRRRSERLRIQRENERKFLEEHPEIPVRRRAKRVIMLRH